jgi:hypothetical protein
MATSAATRPIVAPSEGAARAMVAALSQGTSAPSDDLGRRAARLAVAPRSSNERAIPATNKQLMKPRLLIATADTALARRL